MITVTAGKQKIVAAIPLVKQGKPHIERPDRRVPNLKSAQVANMD